MSTQFQQLEIKESPNLQPNKYYKLKCFCCILCLVFFSLSIIELIIIIKKVNINIYSDSNDQNNIVDQDNYIQTYYDYDYILTQNTIAPTNAFWTKLTNSPSRSKDNPLDPIINTKIFCDILKNLNTKPYPSSINKKYNIAFNTTIMQADYVVYIQPTISNRCDTCNYFKNDPYGINTLKTADYKYTGYDRGHLVPNADYGSDTYIITNAVPMMPNFNRGSWKKSESDIRNKYKNKLIYKGCDYSHKYIKTINDRKLYIPVGCYYIVFDSNDITQTKQLKILDYGYLKNKDLFNLDKKLPSWIKCYI